MTLNEAMAAHGPDWLGIWMPVLFGGAFILPLTLLIWKPTRLAAIVTVLASFLGALTTNMLYSKMGYVKLLGLPHIIFWTPIVIYLFTLLRKPAVGKIPTGIITVVSVVILISLAFDYTDVIKYLLGDRAAAV